VVAHYRLDVTGKRVMDPESIVAMMAAIRTVVDGSNKTMTCHILSASHYADKVSTSLRATFAKTGCEFIVSSDYSTDQVSNLCFSF
jgi:hypothetical protein